MKKINYNFFMILIIKIIKLVIVVESYYIPEKK